MPSTTTISTTEDQQTAQGPPPAPIDPISNERIAALLAKTGYSLVQENGQRKYGGPPPNYPGKTPLRGCEVFVGKLPRDLLEDEMVPVFERVGPLWEIRLMMDFNGQNRGFAFVTYTCREDAKRAVRELDNFEIRRNKHIGVVPSVDNCRIFVGGIPRNRTRAEVKVEVSKLTDGVVDVILYQSAGDKSKNRGFAFVEYESHKAAAMARRKLAPGKIQLWGNAIAVDWAEPEQDVDEETMSNVKILYVRNLMLSTPEEKLRDFVENLCPNAVERVKKLRDYAFVHFYKREDALSAMGLLDGNELDGAVLEVVLAKPPDKSLMRYVKSVQKIGSIMAGANGGGIHANIVNAATNLYHQTSGNLSLSPQPLSPESGIFSPGFNPAPWADPYNGGFLTNPNDKAQQQRNMMNNRRVRGAAGMRGAGARQEVANMVRSVLNPQIGKRLNDCQLLELPANMAPMSASFKPAKSCCQVLEELCKQQGLGQPQYDVQSATVKDELDNEVTQFLGKVSIPALFQLGSVGLGRLAPTADVAKEQAAQLCLWKLGLQYVPGMFPAPMALYPTPTPFFGPASPAMMPSVYYHPAAYFSTTHNGTTFWPHLLQPSVNPAVTHLVASKTGDVQPSTLPGFPPLGGSAAIPSNSYQIPTTVANSEFVLPPAYSQQ